MIVKPDPVSIIPRKVKFKINSIIKKFILLKLIEGVFDSVINLNLDKDICLKRALGRRYDSLTNSYFHLDTLVPPVDNGPLIERLNNISEIEKNEVSFN